MKIPTILPRISCLIFFMVLLAAPAGWAADRFWIGGDGAWSDIAHWSTTSGGAGGASVPGIADRARFTSASGTGTCTLDADVDVRGIIMAVAAANPVTIDQNTRNITVGDQNATFTTGTFTGGSGNITFNGTVSINGSGMSFTSTSGTLTANSTFAISAGSFSGSTGNLTFNSTFTMSGSSTTFTSTSAGTFLCAGTFAKSAGTFNGSSGTITLAGACTHSGGTFNTTSGAMTVGGTLTVSGGTIAISAAGTCTANGDIVLTNGYINTGTLTVSADNTITLNSGFDAGTATLRIAGNGNQSLVGNSTTTAGNFLAVDINKTGGTLTMSGTIRTGKNWTYTAGTVDPGASTVVFATTLTITSATGTLSLSSVTVSGGHVTVAAGTTLTVDGTLTLTNGYADTGTIDAKGDIALNTAFDGGTAALTVTGTGSQTLTGGGSTTAGTFLTLTINRAAEVGGSKFVLSGIIRTTYGWTYTAGTVDVGSSTVVSAGTLTIAGSPAFYNFMVTAGTATVTAGTTVTVNNTLTLTNGYINAGTVDAKGDIALASTFDGGTAALTVTGTGSQTLTGGGSTTAGTFLALTINRAAEVGGSKFVLSGIIRTGYAWTYVAGTVDAGSTVDASHVVFDINNLTITPSGVTSAMSFQSVTFGARTSRTYTIAAGTTLTVNGTLNLTRGAVATGTIDAKGDVTVGIVGNRSFTGGTATLSLSGSVAQTITSSSSTVAQYNYLPNTVSVKAGADVTVTGHLRFYDATVASGGSLAFAGGSTYYFYAGRTITVASGASIAFAGSSGSLVTLRSTSTTTSWKLNVDTAGAYTAEYVDVQRSNAAGGRQIVAYNSTDSGNNANWAFANKLAFTTASQRIVQNAVSAVITVQMQDGAGTAITADRTVTLALSSTSATGLFSSNALFSDQITSIAIPAGSSSASFYYKDTTAGTHTMTAAESPSVLGLVAATQDIVVESKGAWRYKVPITVTSTLALTDYQVKLSIDTQTPIAQGKMKADGSDIRFYAADEKTSLYYWIESGVNTTATVIWVKVPALIVGDTLIYMYYGNAAAVSAASGSGTFDFFDDFDGAALGSDWGYTTTAALNPPVVASSNVTVYRGAVRRLSAVLSSPKDRIIEGRGKWLLNTPGSYAGMMIANASAVAGSNSTGKALVFFMMNGTGGSSTVSYYAADGTVSGYNLGSGTLFTASIGTYYIMGFAVTAENTVKYYRDYTQLRSLTGSWDQPCYFWLGYFTGSSAGTTDIKDVMYDWVRARKYAATVPTVTKGAEELAITQIKFSSYPASVIQNHASDAIYIQTQGYDGTPVNVTAATVINLTTTSGGQFSLDKEPFVAVTQATILANTNNIPVYYMDTTVGDPTLGIAETPDVGWTNDTVQLEVKPEVGSFRVEVATPQVAGVAFTLTITALDEGGNIATSYAGTVNLTAGYVSPAAGTGTLAVTSVTGFVSGVVTVANQSFSDCGVITIDAADAADPSITGASANIDLRPYDFSLELSAVDVTLSGDLIAQHTVAKPFTLEVTARNAAGVTCPNYKGTANLSVSYDAPSTDQGGALATNALGPDAWIGGVATVTDETYNRWGRIAIIAKDAVVTTRTGTSGKAVFLPQDLAVTLTPPPPHRAFYYVNESFTAAVTVRDYAGGTVTNYQGTVVFAGSDLTLPAQYTYTLNDLGVHQFTTLNGVRQTETNFVVTDSAYAAVKGTSGTITLKEGKIRAVAASGPVGTVSVPVQVTDASGTIMTDDDATTFLVTITEFMSDNSSCTAPATITPVTVTKGSATIPVSDSEAETVTVTPSSTPVLEAAGGNVRFGTVSGSGAGIQFWREIRGRVAAEGEE